MLLKRSNSQKIDVCVVSQGVYCEQMSDLDIHLQKQIGYTNIIKIHLHQLGQTIKTLSPNTFIILQSKQLVINRFLQEQLQQANKKQSTIIMVPTGINLQTKHLVAKNSCEIVNIIRQNSAKLLNSNQVNRSAIENKSSKIQNILKLDLNKTNLIILKSNYKEFNTLMSVLEIKYKQKDNVVINWICSVKDLTDYRREYILIISQQEIINNPQLQKQIDNLRPRPFLILFKSTLNRNQSSIKFNIQTSSILGIQKLIDSSDYKTYFKTPLFPSNIHTQISYSAKIVLFTENIEPKNIDSISLSKNQNMIKQNESIKVFKTYTSAGNLLQNNKGNFIENLENKQSCVRNQIQSQNITSLNKIQESINQSLNIQEQKKSSNLMPKHSISLQNISSQPLLKINQRQLKKQPLITKIEETNTKILPKQNLISQPSKDSQIIIPACSLKPISKINQSHIIVDQPTNQQISQIIKIATANNLNQTIKKVQPQRKSYLMSNIGLPPKSSAEAINNSLIVQVVIRQCQRLNKLASEFQKQSYHIECYSTLNQLQIISNKLSPLLPTVHVTDGGFEEQANKYFKHFNKFNTLTIEKGKTFPPPLIRQNSISSQPKDDSKIISSQLKTYITRINSVNKSLPKSSQFPSGFNLLIKDNLMNKIKVDEFLKPRMFSPPFLPSGIEKSKPNVIVIEQEDYSRIKKQLSPQDKIIVLAQEGQLIKQDSYKAILTTRNPDAVTGYIRKLSIQSRANTYILYNYEQSILQQQIDKKMKGKLIQLKYHDEQSLLKKVNQNSNNKLIVVLDLKYLKLVKQIQQIKKNIHIIAHEPTYRFSTDNNIRVSKTMNQLISELESLTSKN